MHIDSYTRKRTWIVASYGLKIQLESNWEIEVKFNTQFGSKCIGCDILNFFFFSHVSGEKDDTIGYFIVSEELKDCIIAFEMQGHRIDLEGTVYFLMGSFYITIHIPETSVRMCDECYENLLTV